MLASTRRLFGSIAIKEKDDVIIIDGLPADTLSRDIKKIWGTTRVAKNLFLGFSRSSIKFYRFYAVEVEYILETIIKGRYATTSRAAAKKVLDKLREETWLAGTKVDQPSTLNTKALRKFHKKPLASQAAFFEMYDKNTQAFNLNGYMLASPPGTGKTLSGLMLAAQKEATVTIIVALNVAVQRPWVQTLESEYKGKAPTYWTSHMKRDFNGKDEFLICHYEALGRVLDNLSVLQRKECFIILDESHNFNEIKSQRTQNFVDLCLKLRSTTKGVLWMSGTPLKAMGTEMIPFLRSVDPMFTSKVEDSFRKVFGVSQARAVDVLSHRIGLMSYNIDKSEVVDNNTIEKTVKVRFKGMEAYTLSSIREEMRAFIEERIAYYKKHRATHEKQYNDILAGFHRDLTKSKELEDFVRYKKRVRTISNTTDLKPLSEEIQWVNRYEDKVIIPALPREQKKVFRHVKSIIKYTHLKIRGEALGRILGKKRAECNRDMVRHAGLPTIIDASEKKTLIFTSYVEVLKECDKVLSKEGYEPLLVYGETNKELEKSVVKLESDEKANPMVATYQSLSTAVPILAANSVVLMNQPFRSHERSQAISRVDRKGQDARVRVFNILLDTGDEPNISTRSLDIMRWSQDQVDMMMGVKTDGIAIESLDVIEMDRHTLPKIDRALTSTDWL